MRKHDDEYYKKIIEEAGGKFLGVTKDLAIVWFNEPNGSTLVLKFKDFSKEAVEAKLKKYRGFLKV